QPLARAVDTRPLSMSMLIGMQNEPASDASPATSAKLPWETPLCEPLDAAEGTEHGKLPMAAENSVQGYAPVS
ncbi:MAG: hypothetical protein EBS05_25405, partial [Proteobacteria bacterium]|nr:hypothetical protein [Pseudomonadota bacterium]